MRCDIKTAGYEKYISTGLKGRTVRQILLVIYVHFAAVQNKLKRNRLFWLTIANRFLFTYPTDKDQHPFGDLFLTT